MSRIERLKAADLREDQPSASERVQKKQHWPKNERASKTPHSNNLVSRAYEHVLFLEAMPSRYRGLASLFGVLLALAAVLATKGLSLTSSFLASSSGPWLFVLNVLGFLWDIALFTIALIAAIRAFRIDLLAPKEIPLVFNRKTRKVYRYAQDIPGLEQLVGPDGKFSILGLGRYLLSTFQPWPNMLLVEYDWDCLEAEYYEVTALAGNVVRTDHHLDLYVRESPGSDKIIGSFALTPSITTGEETGRDLWEHVRRFMEENGPALSPGDQPAPPPPKGFWQGANAPFNGPGWLVFLAGAVWTWEDVYWKVLSLMKGAIDQALWEQALHHSVADSFLGLIAKSFVIFISYIAMAWVFFAVLAAYLSPHVDLPAELTADAGEKVDLEKLAAAQAVPAQ